MHHAAALVKCLSDKAAQIAEVEQLQHQKQKVHVIFMVRDTRSTGPRVTAGMRFLPSQRTRGKKYRAKPFQPQQEFVQPAEQQVILLPVRSFPAGPAAAKSRGVKSGRAASIVKG